MDAVTIHQRLGASFGSGVGACVADVRDPFILIEPGVICDVGRVLHDDPEMAFDSLSNLTGVDYKEEGHLQVVYHLYSYPHRHNIVLKVNAPRDTPIVPSVESVWKTANWLEREVYDLVGVTFTNHPDLRRLLMPEDWVGHPLRKDFVEPEEYHGINTRRESLLR